MRSQGGSSSHYLDNIPRGRATIKKKKRREEGIKIPAKASDGSRGFYEEGEDIGGHVQLKRRPS